MSRGFTILEVLIAIFILTTGIGGVYGLIHFTLSFTSTTHNQLVASYLAQEGVEIVRNIRDSNFLRIRSGVPGANWKDGIDVPAGLCGGGCKTDYNDASLNPVSPLDPMLRDGTLWSYDSGVSTSFQRSITITPDGPNKIFLEVKVAWQERGEHSVIASSELYNWLSP